MTDNLDITTSNHYIEHELNKRLMALGDVLDSDVISIAAPMYAGIDDLVRAIVEEIPTTDVERKESLSVVLETDGGSIEVVERIADVLRHHYSNGDINFIVPNRSQSCHVGRDRLSDVRGQHSNGLLFGSWAG